MPCFPIHSIETAPAASKSALQALQSAFGFIPNVAGAMSTSPVLITALTDLFGRVHGGSFSEPEIQILLLTNAVANASEWPVAFHSALAMQQGIDAADVSAIRAGKAPSDSRVAALSKLARTLIEQRGHLADTDIEAFLAAGFDEARLLEAVAVIAASTITNYTASITMPPLEDVFASHRWQPV
jgi:alkylhydroperoxidase family enzyme